MRFRGVAFGSHERTADLVCAAGHPLKPLGPALALGP